MMDQYITLAKAAEDSPYSQEYLGLLVRKGKIQAKRFGRNWYTTQAAVQDYIRCQEEALLAKIQRVSKVPVAQAENEGLASNGAWGTIGYAAEEFRWPRLQEQPSSPPPPKELPADVLGRFLRHLVVDLIILGLAFGSAFIGGALTMNVIREPGLETLQSAAVGLGSGVADGWRRTLHDLIRFVSIEKSNNE